MQDLWICWKQPIHDFPSSTNAQLKSTKRPINVLHIYSGQGLFASVMICSVRVFIYGKESKGSRKVNVSKHIYVATGTWRDDNVIMTSKQRHDVVLASSWRYHCVVCPLGWYPRKLIPCWRTFMVQWFARFSYETNYTYSHSKKVVTIAIKSRPMFVIYF